MFGFKERRAMRDARRRSDIAALESIRDENARRMRFLRGPGYCESCVEMLVAQGMRRDAAIRTVRERRIA